MAGLQVGKAKTPGQQFGAIAGMPAKPETYVDDIGRRMALATQPTTFNGQATPGAQSWQEVGPALGGGAGGAPGAGAGGGAYDTPDWAAALSQLQQQLKPAASTRVAAPTAPAAVGAPVPAANQPSSSQGFARAKDASSRIGNQALKALRSQMVDRGIEGSGIEGRLSAGILGDVASQQSDAAYQQSKMADEQGWDAAKLGYQGALTQRSQNIGLEDAAYQGEIGQRGQDLAQSNAWMQLAPSVLSLLARGMRY